MPYKTESETLGLFLDKRVKLLPCQREMVVYWHNRGMSQRALAKMFKVSRRLITFIIDPLKLEANRIRLEERGGSKKYYNKDKHREYIKKHRRRKHKILSK